MLIGVQFLRAIAATMVVLSHIDLQATRAYPGYVSGAFDFGHRGVDIFFVISGLIMGLQSAKPELTPSKFAVRRLARIVPLYWAVTLFTAGVAYFAPQVMETTRFSLVHVIGSLLFLPMPHPSYDGYFPVVIPGWTLNYEMFFYAIMTVAMFTKNRIEWAIMAVLVAALLPFFFDLGGMAEYWPRSLIREFAFGLGIAWLVPHRHGPGRTVGIVVAAFGFAILLSMPVVPDQLRGAVWGLPAAMVVGGMAMLNLSASGPVARGLLLIGNASYSLYLTHVLVIPVVTKVLKVLHLVPDYPAVFFGLNLCISLVCAILVWRFFETGATRLVGGALDRLVYGTAKLPRPAPSP